MAAPCPRLYVRVPTPTPRRYGLIASAVTVNETDPHFACGVQFEPVSCDVSHSWCQVCPPTGDGKTLDRGVALVEADPFTVYADLACSAPSMTDPVMKDRVTSTLTLGEGRAVETVFWTGLAGPEEPDDESDPCSIMPHLADDTAETGAVTLSETPLTPVGAMVELESAMGECYGGDAYIHVPSGALAALAQHGYIQRDGNVLRTLAGSVVVVGGGYPGTAPDGTAPVAGSSWIYATGTVYIWRGPVSFVAGDPGQYINRANNDAVLIAERTFVLAWDCCHFATPVSIS
jgi:hypothetical protein